MQTNLKNTKIAIIGLGYVGLPLAVEFSKKFKVIGFDVNLNRINELKNGHDRTQEIESKALVNAINLTYSSTIEEITDCNVYIVTVPTPIDKYKKPDISPLLSASKAVGKVLKKNDIVIFESTVYPGCTEEDCVPVLEKESGLKFNNDFYCGYSPERINPGDKKHTVAHIKKVTSGSTPQIADFVDQLYLTTITAGTFKASSIKVAEAAKVIENCQRDINIAFVNELALIFRKMDIDTKSVLEAAGSKWNFLNFSPGLVGGHCIGVDPYYLTHKAESLGYNPQVILSGRRINDNMGKYVAGQVIKLLIKNDQSIKNAPILILGITFKENCPDIRNSRVIDIIDELQEYNADIDVFDPWADAEEVKQEYQIKLIQKPDFKKYKAIVLAVSHHQFLESAILDNLKNFSGILYDVKSILDLDIITERL
jgi:UDP-N-acetyl-D-glucosamine/UDP-N-acetyl-D-galactosamine dehydrogenase